MDTRALSKGAKAAEKIPRRQFAAKPGTFIPVTLENFISQKEGRIKPTDTRRFG
jgi:hypothetical protein